MLRCNRGCSGQGRDIGRDFDVTNYFSSFTALGLAVAVAIGLTAAVALPTGGTQVAPRVAANDLVQLEPILVVGNRPVEIASR